MNLRNIGSVKEGAVNDVRVCEIEETQEWVTLWDVKKHSLIRVLIDLLEKNQFATAYMDGERLNILMPYEEPRPFFRFRRDEGASWEERRRGYENITSACENCRLPYPILYLLLIDECLNIRQDGSIFFTYYISLDDLDPDREEQDCVRLCARILAELMKKQGRKEERACLALIQRKLKRNVYYHFTDIAHDLKFIDGKRHKSLIWGRIPYPEQSAKDKAFRILAIVTAVLAILAIVLFVSQIAFGEIPMGRFFSQVFEKIGTESLLQ